MPSTPEPVYETVGTVGDFKGPKHSRNAAAAVLPSAFRKVRLRSFTDQLLIRSNLPLPALLRAILEAPRQTAWIPLTDRATMADIPAKWQRYTSGVFGTDSGAPLADCLQFREYGVDDMQRRKSTELLG